MKIALLREGKIPADKRVALSPKQCLEVLNQYPGLVLVVQPSPIRKFTDQDYLDLGIILQEDLSDCDVLIGVKEVPKKDLIPHKTYFYFSHTIKEQPYNKSLLLKMLSYFFIFYYLLSYKLSKNETVLKFSTPFFFK